MIAAGPAGWWTRLGAASQEAFLATSRAATTLGAPADEGFEAWELVGPDGLRTVSLPGR